jgi:transcriptional regulator NrdR family protein
MDCPRCKSPETRVIKSRHNAINTIRRVRKCSNCGNRMTTIEHIKEPGKKPSNEEIDTR